MKADRRWLEALEIRRRAAEVRRLWSRAEQVRRLGLPPDIPFLLRLSPDNRCGVRRSVPQPLMPQFAGAPRSSLRFATLIHTMGRGTME